MNGSGIRRAAAVTACAVIGGLTAFTAPASASVNQGAGRATPSVVTPAATFGCRSVPRFVLSVDGAYSGSGVNIRSGPSTSCTIYGAGYPGQALKVWCVYRNPSTLVYWFYLNDRTTGIRGWSVAAYVGIAGNVPTCS